MWNSASVQSDETAATLNDRLRFEALLSGLFAQFVHLPSDDVDRTIEDAQGAVCQCLGVDRSILYQLSADGRNRMVLTHVWQLPSEPPVEKQPDPQMNSDSVLASTGILPVPMGLDGGLYFPGFLAILQRHEPIIIPDVDTMPESLGRERGLMRRFRVRAAVIIPLIAGQQLLGVLTWEMLQSPRFWQPYFVRRLELVAQVFASTLARRRSDQALRESNARLDLAADGAQTGLWSVTCGTDSWWMTDKTREIFGLGAEEVATWERILQAIEPEDRCRVQEVFDTAVRFGAEGTVEYRIRLPGGDTRWLLSRGRQQGNTAAGTGRLMGMTIDITARKLAEQQLKEALDEVQSLREALEQENTQLRQQIRQGEGHELILGESPAVLQMLAQARRVGPTDSVVLIMGETGTGKELLADAIHQLSRRSKRDMKKVNCAALPPTLIESELFGRERGAYTGAMSQQPGRFEAADGSTLFLDEIAELPLDLQAKMLRVLQEGQFERLGSSRTRKVDVRVLAATNRNLAEMVREGQFRADLFYRLNVFPITVPPLRNRKSDIPILVWKFVRHFATKMGKSIDSIPRHAMEMLVEYSWPGNIRELRNLIERAVILSDSRVLRLQQIPADSLASAPITLAEAERQHILEVLNQTSWRISGPKGAAAMLGLVPTTLHSKMKKLGIDRQTSTAMPRHARRAPSTAEELTKYR